MIQMIRTASTPTLAIQTIHPATPAVEVLLAAAVVAARLPHPSASAASGRTTKRWACPRD